MPKKLAIKARQPWDRRPLFLLGGGPLSLESWAALGLHTSVASCGNTATELS